MVLTKKIEIVVEEQDQDLKKEYFKNIVAWKFMVRNCANELISYLYSVDKLKYYKFITHEAKVELGIIGAKGKSVKEGSAPYVLLSERLKGLIPMDIANALQQNVTKSYNESRSLVLKGLISLKSYNSLPIPFSGSSIRNLQYLEDRDKFVFDLFGIKFSTKLGRDRSNNKDLIKRCIAKEVSIRGSSLDIDEKRNKIFLLLGIEVPKKNIILEENNFIDARLSPEIPIIATFGTNKRIIGNKEEYLHRRIQIQNALRRAQVNALYSNGGRGRKRKIQALDRFKDKEKEYINTKLHTYSKLLIDFALKNKCKTIYLINQNFKKEGNIKQDAFLLRNWGYYGLKQKLVYKAKLFGINIIEKAS